MPKPAVWQNDPDCGHEVACAFQTHYCTYIRAPRLLTLQRPQTPHPAEPLAILALQAYELWFAVLLSDLRAALARLAQADPTYEPAKLLRRCSRILQLLDRQTDAVEAALDPEFGVALQPSPRGAWSPQFAELQRLARRLEKQLRESPPAPTQAEAGRECLAVFKAWKPRFAALTGRLFRAEAAAPAYTAYLALDELLTLQDGVKADWTPKGQPPAALAPAAQVSPDELMFIVVHQGVELWFKAILTETDAALALLQAAAPDVPAATRRLRGVVEIQRLLAEQIHIPATMLPLDFFRFRGQTKVVDGVTYELGLSPSSGTESYQFREIEIVAGLKADAAHQEFLRGHPRLPVRYLTPRQRERLAQPTLPDAFERALAQRGLANVLDIFTPADVPNPHADLAELADVLLEFDKFFRSWRINHATMVQSMIGERSGTGYLGPEYLRETAGLGLQGEGRIFATSQARPRFFEKLWEARTRLRAR